ncbi:MAG TPA: TolC family protein [Gemmatimonadaceae bacterium]|jgi:outer membrane protein|nr:TolC family protein [Gemmatimonadaceae bacterium]
MKRILVLLGLVVVSARAAAQSVATDSATVTLTIEQAIELARRNNPELQQTLNNRIGAQAAVRSAYGALLPSADASFNVQRQQGGQQIFSGTSLGASSDVNQSSYQIGFGYRLNSATLIAPSLQRANRDAVEADITGATETLRNNVSQQYLTTLQAQANADLQDSLVVAAQQELVLAQAREIVGSGTQLDVQRADVALGLQKVQALKARNQVEIEKLRLFQVMGTPQPANVKLVTEFPVTPVRQTLNELLALAQQQNPSVLALRSRQHVADLTVRREKGEYSPTLTLSTGIGGYTYGFANSNFPVQQAAANLEASRTSCIRTEEVRAALGLSNQLAECNAMTFTSTDAQAIRDQNARFPFNFTKSPRSVSATLSLPIFDGFAREQRLQEAMASRSDARYMVRAKELALTADVTAAYLTLQTAEKTVTLQEQNAAKAKQELKLVQDRYRIGATTYVDLTEARATYERAESDRITAIYDYHKAFAALESAVGHSLR